MQEQHAQLKAAAEDTTLQKQLEQTQQRLDAALSQQASLHTDAATARADCAAATARASTLQERASAAEQAAAEKAAAADEKARVAEAVRAEADGRVDAAERAAQDAVDALTVKRAMLESSAEQVAELKVELEDAVQCAPLICFSHFLLLFVGMHS